MRVITVLIGIVAIAVLTAVSCFACDCLDLTEAQSFERADAVFIGRVIDIQDIDVQGQLPKAIFTFTVEKSLKGVDSEEWKITSHLSDCDAGFYLGWKYIVYAQKFEREYHAGSCLSTRALEGPPAPSNNSMTLNSTEPWYRNSRKIMLFTLLSVLGLFFIGLLVREIRKPVA
jgi:hypothetical protein